MKNRENYLLTFSYELEVCMLIICNICFIAHLFCISKATLRTDSHHASDEVHARSPARSIESISSSVNRPTFRMSSIACCLLAIWTAFNTLTIFCKYINDIN